MPGRVGFEVAAGRVLSNISKDIHFELVLSLGHRTPDETKHTRVGA